MYDIEIRQAEQAETQRNFHSNQNNFGQMPGDTIEKMIVGSLVADLDGHYTERRRPANENFEVIREYNITPDMFENSARGTLFKTILECRDSIGICPTIDELLNHMVSAHGNTHDEALVVKTLASNCNAAFIGRHGIHLKCVCDRFINSYRNRAAVSAGKPTDINVPHPEILTGRLKTFADMMAHSSQTHPDFVKQVILGVISGIVSRGARLDWRKTTENVNLWQVIVLAASEHKSTVFNKLTNVVFEINRGYEEEYKKSVAAKNAESKRGHADTSNIPRKALTIQDTTPEHTVDLLQHNRSLCRFDSEFTLGNMVIDAYKQNGARMSLAMYLKLWSGDAVQVGTKKDGSTTLIKRYVSVLSLAQPGVVNSLTEMDMTKSSGFLSRILWSIPDSLVGSRKMDADRVPECEIAWWNDAIERLIQKFYVPLDQEPMTFTITDRAWEMLRAYGEAIEPAIKDSPYADALGKLEMGYPARLAVALHVLKHFECDEIPLVISGQTMGLALKLANYYLCNLTKAAPLLKNKGIDDIKLALKWLHRRRTFVVRDFYRGLHIKQKAAVEMLETLESWGCIEFNADHYIVHSAELPRRSGGIIYPKINVPLDEDDLPQSMPQTQTEPRMDPTEI